MDFVALHGRGLHSGGRCAVRLLRRPGPVAFVHDGRELTLGELEIARVDRGVSVRVPEIGFEVDLVEHLLSAMAGIGVTSGIAIDVSGGEVPLLDGAAFELSRALIALDPPRGAPALRVLEDGDLTVGQSRYVLRKKDALEIRVEVDFSAHGLGVEQARWGGSSLEFLDEIARARTFGFESDADALRQSGRAAWVDPDVVVVFGRDGEPLSKRAPPLPNELARHKLLDLLGDLYLFGGPPIGSLHAYRPGHAANHHVLKTALARGLIGRN